MKIEVLVLVLLAVTKACEQIPPTSKAPVLPAAGHAGWRAKGSGTWSMQRAINVQ